MQKNETMPIEPGNIIFYCFTSVLDEMILKQQGKVFDQQLADTLNAKGQGFYFAVSFDYDYRVIPAKVIDDLHFPSGEQTDMIEACMHHYISTLF